MFGKSNIQLYYGLEVLIKGEAVTYNLTRFKVQNNHLSIDEVIDSIDLTSQKLDKDIPMVVVVHGKGVLYRILNKAENQEDKFKRLLPNADPLDFYFQEHFINPGQEVISIMRREPIEKIIAQLLEHNLNINRFYLGGSVQSEICSDLDALEDVAEIAGYQVSLKNSSLESFSFNGEISGSYNYGEVVIPGKVLVLFSALIQYLTVSDNIKFPLISQLEEFGNNRIYNNKFKRVCVSVLILLFFTLVINQYLHSKWGKEETHLMYEYNSIKSQSEEEDRSNSAFLAHRKFLEETDLASGSNNSFYADQIGLTIDKNITLERMTIFPERKVLGNLSKEISFNKKSILVSGNCDNSVFLNNWIRALSEEDWVHRVEIINYIYDEKEKSGNFNLQINLR